jgi:hypothetical protein
MANIRDAIRSHLLATPQVSGVTQVVRPGVLAEHDLPPAIIVKVVGDAPHEFLNSAARQHRARIAIQAYGDDVTASDTLADLIRTYALHPLLKGIVQGVNIRDCSLEGGPFDDEDQPKDGSDEWMRHVRMDFLVIYNP